MIYEESLAGAACCVSHRYLRITCGLPLNPERSETRSHRLVNSAVRNSKVFSEAIAKLEADLVAVITEPALIGRVIAPIVENRRSPVLEKRATQTDVYGAVIILAIHCQTGSGGLKRRRAKPARYIEV